MEEINTELSSAHDVKILLCYLLDKLNRPVSEKQLYEIVLDSRVINYFYYTESIEALLENGSISKQNINDVHCFVLEEKGRMGATYFNEYIPYHFRRRILKAALMFYAKLRRESETEITITNTHNGCELNCIIKDTSYDLMRISIYAPDRDQAEVIKEKILLNPAEFYTKVITYALNNREEEPDVNV